MAGIWAGRTGPGRRIVALDGAKRLGAKILVAGGGRCNVTHHEVDETAYAGSSRNAIRKVLRRFEVSATVEFFRELGVELKREESGKLFPVTDDAHTVLDALLGAARDAGVALWRPWRVGAVSRREGGFAVTAADGSGEIRARRVILATGGMALPRTGSDGQGYQIARALGHSVTERLFPALVPLTLPRGHFLCGLSGVAAPATLELREASGKRVVSFTGPVLCTHFGVSGPAVMDMSRYFLEVRGRVLVVNWLPAQTREGLDGELLRLGARSVGRFLGERLPERLAAALCAEAGVEGVTPGHSLTREQRRAVAGAVCEMPLPVTGDRGFTYAEATAGGVPLSEIHLETMESRVCLGLHLCGEICDVDGRIGGFNFQWAWASGFVAGCGAASAD